MVLTSGLVIFSFLAALPVCSLHIIGMAPVENSWLIMLKVLQSAFCKVLPELVSVWSSTRRWRAYCMERGWLEALCSSSIVLRCKFAHAQQYPKSCPDLSALQVLEKGCVETRESFMIL